MSDDDAMKRVLCIHFPHKLSELFQRTLAQPVLVDLLVRLIGPNVKAVQSMLFLKASGKPGQAWHQDEDFIPTRDRTLTGAWIALDDCHGGKRLPLGAAQVAAARHPLAAKNPLRYPLRLHAESFAFPTTTRTRFRWR